MKQLYIRKLDKHNFTLATQLDEPKIVTIKDTEIVYLWDRLPVYYGTISGAITGLIKHSKSNITIDIPKEIGNIKPDDVNESYIPFLEVRLDEIQQVINQTTKG